MCGEYICAGQTSRQFGESERRSEAGVCSSGGGVNRHRVQTQRWHTHADDKLSEIKALPHKVTVRKCILLLILDKLQTYAVIRNKILRLDAEQGLDSGAHRDNTAAH